MSRNKLLTLILSIPTHLDQEITLVMPSILITPKKEQAISVITPENEPVLYKTITPEKEQATLLLTIERKQNYPSNNNNIILSAHNINHRVTAISKPT